MKNFGFSFFDFTKLLFVEFFGLISSIGLKVKKIKVIHLNNHLMIDLIWIIIMDILKRKKPNAHLMEVSDKG